VGSLAARCLRGEITLATALSTASDPVFAVVVHASDVEAITTLVLQQAQGGNLEVALVLSELLLTGLEARRDDPATPDAVDGLRDTAALAWINAVTRALTHVPDWRRYASARDAGDRVLARAARRKDVVAYLDAQAELAALHFHPIVNAMHGVDTWSVAAAEWYARGDTNGLTAAGDRYPEPAEAFAVALGHYEEWGRGTTGRIKGLALNGQVASLEWSARVAGQPIPDRALTLAAEALELLDPALDAAEISYLIALRHSHGLPLDVDALQAVLAIPVETLMETLGAANAVNVRINLAELLRPISAKLALAAIENAAPAVVVCGDETMFVRHSNALLSALLEHMVDGATVPEGPVLAAASQAAATAQAEDWPFLRLAGVLLTIVGRAHQTNEEEDALRVYDVAHSIAEDPFNAYPAAFRYLLVSLTSGAAVNAKQNGDWGMALSYYARALELALPLNLTTFSRRQLANLIDSAEEGGPAQLLAILGEVFKLGLQLEQRLGRDAVDRLQYLAQRLTEQQIASGSINSEVLHFTWRLAKARRFSDSWRTRATACLKNGDQDLAMLAHIAMTAAPVPLVDQASGPGSRIARDRRLLAFVRDDLPAAGTTPAEQLANLQQRYDRVLEQRLTLLASAQEATVHSLEEIREALDAKTVVLQLFLGQYKEKRAVIALLASKETIEVSVVPDATPLMLEMREGDRIETAYSYEEDVYLMRSAILEDTFDAEQIAPYLNAAGGAFLHGSIGKALDTLHDRGCDHLVIVPHGPYHFAPLHLYARKQRLLADEWTVTVMPSADMLVPLVFDRPRRHGLSVFGLDFRENNPHGLPELVDVMNEVRDVAAAFGSTPITNDEATQTALFQELTTSRYVHLATHGALNLDAPAFQMLVMAPSAETDGIVHAHEILALDLTGLELVTLGACESALGRIDRSDNPRGLPAAFLLAGAQCVIGTLWSVASDTAHAFFTLLYGKLSEECPRREAFRYAQVETRKRFPDARDWGAFYLVGDPGRP